MHEATAGYSRQPLSLDAIEYMDQECCSSRRGFLQFCSFVVPLLYSHLHCTSPCFVLKNLEWESISFTFVSSLSPPPLLYAPDTPLNIDKILLEIDLM